jgi:hypothetical protein
MFYYGANAPRGATGPILAKQAGGLADRQGGCV